LLSSLIDPSGIFLMKGSAQFQATEIKTPGRLGIIIFVRCGGIVALAGHRVNAVLVVKMKE